MKRLLFIVVLFIFILSCRKDDKPEVFDFNISGIERIDARVEETRTVRLLITCNDGTPENVYLTLEDVPEGITCTFNRVAGVPEYSSDLEISVSRSVSGGLHTLKLIGSSSSAIKEFPIEINIDKSLSAAFTVYSAVNFDPDDINSSLADSALIQLYKDEATFATGVPDYKEYTQKNGRAYFYKLVPGSYLFTVDKGDMSNVVQKRSVCGLTKGYVVAGMFRTQQEIINSAQPKAKLGDLKFRDINADNKINESDLGQYDHLSIYEGEINEKVIWIGK